MLGGIAKCFLYIFSTLVHTKLLVDGGKTVASSTFILAGISQRNKKLAVSEIGG